MVKASNLSFLFTDHQMSFDVSMCNTDENIKLRNVHNFFIFGMNQIELFQELQSANK